MKHLFAFFIAMASLLASAVLPAQTMIINTVAGTGATGFSGDGGPATAAIFDHVFDVASDIAGNLYVADGHNHRIRKVDAATGIINTVVGNGVPTFFGDGGPASAASLWYPEEVKLDAANNMYISDQFNHRIRKVNAATGTITTIVGGGSTPYYNGMPGTALDAAFTPRGLGVDAAGNCYFMGAEPINLNARILRWDATTGSITAVIDSSGAEGYSGDGGLAVDAKLNNQNFYPGLSVGIDPANNLYVTDIFNYRIRKVANTTGIITTIAGNGSAGASGDGGPAAAATLSYTARMAVDNNNDLYFFDFTTIRKINGATGVITTIAGGGSSSAEYIPATAARIYNPYGLAIDGAHNVYYADGNGFVRRLTPGCTTVLPGTITSSIPGAVFCDSALAILTLSGAATGGDISYQWRTSTDSVNWVNAGANDTVFSTNRIYATTYYKVLVTCNTGGITDSSAVFTLKINMTPVVGAIIGLDSVCVGNTIVLSDTTGGGIWVSGNTALATTSNAGVLTGISAGNVVITYSVPGSCPASSTLGMRVIPLAACAEGLAEANPGTNGPLVYPNPNRGICSFIMRSFADDVVRVTITDPLGRVVKEYVTRTNTVLEVNLQDATGIFILSVVTTGERYQTRLVIAR